MANTMDANGFAYFHVSDGNSLFGNNLVQQIELVNNLGSTYTVVVNVGGTSIRVNSGNIVGSLTQQATRARVLFNFYEARTITMDRGFSGAILAPFAHLQTNAIIDGVTAVQSITTTSELHKPLFALRSC